jgi:hypothetical protein
MANRWGNRGAGEWSEMGPHEEYLELCAVSTSGDLNEIEQKKLQAHLAGCAECRQALREFDAAVDVGVPLLSSKLYAAPSEESVVPQSELAGSVVSNVAAKVTRQAEAGVSTGQEKRGFAFGRRTGHRRTALNWNLIWLPFAACVLLTIALGIYSYRMGRSRNIEVVRVISNSSDPRVGPHCGSEASHRGAIGLVERHEGRADESRTVPPK